MRAQMAMERHDPKSALEWLDKASGSKLNTDPRYWRQLSLAQGQLRLWDQARASCTKLLEIDPDDALAHLGLAICHLHQQNPEQAIASARQATALDFHLPRAHFILARAHLRQRDLAAAEGAVRTALQIAPAFPQALQLLAAICRRTDRWEESANLQAARVTLLERRAQHAHQVEKLRAEAAARAQLRAVNQAAPAAPSSPAPKSPPKDILIVTGLPRSGTSLMMQMLHAGGHPVLTDNKRTADANNERGYFEWEDIKQLPRNPSLIAQADGMAVKVVTPLLPHLPSGHRYKIIFMRRPLEEVARSQHVMRFQQQGKTDDLATNVVPLLQKHLDSTLDLLRRAPGIQMLEVDYPELVRDPQAWAARVADFLDDGRLPQRQAMSEVVKPQLHRQRSK